MANNALSWLPADLFKSREIFDQVVGPHLLQLMDERRLQQILERHLPSSLSGEEKRETVKLLLSNQLNQFNRNPLNSIYMRLKLQKLSPDLLRTLDEVRELKAHALRLEEQKWQCRLLNEVMQKRKTMLERALDTCPDFAKQDYSSLSAVVCAGDFTLNARLVKNAQKRYRQELKELRDDLGLLSTSEEDEDGDEQEIGQKKKDAEIKLRKYFNESRQRSNLLICFFNA